MSFCLPKQFADKFVNALRDGTIQPEKLAAMTSEERAGFFKDIVGEENAHNVNALFESKLLLKDYKSGLVSWAKKVAGMTEAAKRDLVSRIEKMDKILSPTEQDAFLQDLASQKIGARVTFDEAKTITELSKKVQDARSGLDRTSPDGSPSRLEYGSSVVDLQNYVNGLKSQGKPLTAVDVIGVAKSVKASIDNSFWMRQGWKAMFTSPTAWGKNFAKSWGDIYTSLKGNGDAVRSAVRADIFSRENALNGNYKSLGVDLGTGEEAFPTLLPEKFPVLGRFFKASDVAFESGAMRLRADIADKYIKLAQDGGIDFNETSHTPVLGNVTQGKAIGRLVNSLTGKGDLSTLGIKGEGGLVNVAFFSPKLLKSNFDFLTAHNLEPTTAFVRKQAAINLLKVVGGTAAILATANALAPGSVETDPRSADFGKIKIGNTRFDVTGGMGSLVTLAMRIVPLLAGQKAYSKSTITGKVSELNALDKKGQPLYGATTGLDVLTDFMGNKLSPPAGVIRDLLKGQTFGGGKPTLLKEAVNLVAPLPITNTYELMTSPKAANPLLSEIMDALGISTNTYGK